MVAEMRGAQGGLGGTSQRHQAAVWHRDPGVGAKGPPHTLADFMQLDDVFEYNNEPGGDVARARAQAAEVQVAAQARERAATGAHFSKRPQRRRDEAGAVDGGAATHTDLVLVAFQDAMYAGGLTLKDTFSRMDTRQRGRVRLREFRDVVERLSKQLEHKVLARRPPRPCLCVSVPHSLLAAAAAAVLQFGAAAVTQAPSSRGQANASLSAYAQLLCKQRNVADLFRVAVACGVGAAAGGGAALDADGQAGEIVYSQFVKAFQHRRPPVR